MMSKASGGAAGADGLVDQQYREEMIAQLQRALSSSHKEDKVRNDRLSNIVSEKIDAAARGPNLAYEVIKRVGDRWTSLILCILGCGTFRHAELLRIMNLMAQTDDPPSHISQHILTGKLRGLERDGFLKREVWQTASLRTEYSLTPMGRFLFEWVWQMVEWSEAHRSAIEQARAMFNERDGDHRLD